MQQQQQYLQYSVASLEQMKELPPLTFQIVQKRGSVKVFWEAFSKAYAPKLFTDRPLKWSQSMQAFLTFDE